MVQGVDCWVCWLVAAAAAVVAAAAAETLLRQLAHLLLPQVMRLLLLLLLLVVQTGQGDRRERARREHLLLMLTVLVAVSVAVVVLASHDRAGLFRVPRQVVLAPEARLAGGTNVLPESQVSVLVPSEILWCEKLFLALGAAKLAVLRRPC